MPFLIAIITTLLFLSSASFAAPIQISSTAKPTTSAAAHPTSAKSSKLVTKATSKAVKKTIASTSTKKHTIKKVSEKKSIKTKIHKTAHTVKNNSKTTLAPRRKSQSQRNATNTTTPHAIQSSKLTSLAETEDSKATAPTTINPDSIQNSADPDTEDTTANIPAENTEDTTEDTTAKPASFFSWFRGGNRDDSSAESPNSETLANTFNKQPIKLARKTVTTLHYTTYKYGGNRFDPQHGIYMLDCSGYLDNILHRSSPRAYSMLAQRTGTSRPTSEHYYNFFNRLGVVASNTESVQWNKVANPKTLQAGDILVFRYKNKRGRPSGGHVMLVMDKPVGSAGVLKVRVADSAETGHSGDTRGNRSGIGIGTLLLKVNPSTGQPYAFAWRVDSPWNSRVSIAMGRPPTV